jgi:hypothetical protein
MKNINSYVISKISLIRYLLVFLVLTTGLGALAEEEGTFEHTPLAGDEGLGPISLETARRLGEVRPISLETARRLGEVRPISLETARMLSPSFFGTTSKETARRLGEVRPISLETARMLSPSFFGTTSNETARPFTNLVQISQRGGTVGTAITSETVNTLQLNGKWRKSEGRTYTEIPLEDSLGNPHYTLEVTESGDFNLSLKNTNSDCETDPYLYLLDDEGKFLAQNDDAREKPCIHDSGIQDQNLDKGKYTLVAATYAKDDYGDFTISVTGSKDTFTLDKLARKKSVLSCSGKWNPSVGLTSGNPYNDPKYLLTISREQEVIIDLSSKTDNVLFLLSAESRNIYDGERNSDIEIATNDDRVIYYDRNALINQRLKPGHYVIVASTFNRKVTGDFNLSIKLEDDRGAKLDCAKTDQENFYAGEDVTIVWPENAHSQPATGGTGTGVISYTSSNPDFRVDRNGNVTFDYPGSSRITATKATDDNYYEASASYQLTVEKAEQWIDFPEITGGKLIKNTSDEEFSVRVVGGIWEGEKKISQGQQDGVKFTINNYSHSASPVYIFDSSNRMRPTKIGRTTIEAIKKGNEFFKDAEAEFVLEVRPGKVAFTAANNLYTINNLNKVCGDSFVIGLSLDGKSLRDNKTFRESVLKNDNAVSPYQGLFTFDSDNINVATVNKNTGKVNVVGLGSAMITATSLFGDSSIPPVASYILYVDDKGNQAIQFKGDKSVLLYGSDISKTINKEIVDGWGEHPINFTLKEDILGFIDLNNTSGEVKIDIEPEKAPQIYNVSIVAEKPEDSCYLKAEDTYSITYYKNALHSPKLGQKWDKEYEIKWSFPDYDSGKKVKLSYTNFLPDKFGEIRNKELIKEVDISEGSYKWNTSALPEGDYYIIAEFEGEPANSNNCGISGIDDCFMPKNPVEIEHDYGLVMDCSKWYNYPAELGVPPNTCPRRYMALLNDKKSLISWGMKDNLVLRSGNSFSKIYPTQETFLALTKDGKIRTVEDNDVADNNQTPNHLDDFTSIYSAIAYDTGHHRKPGGQSFAGKRNNGSIFAWNGSLSDSVENVTKLITSDSGFVALKDDGSISIWSNPMRITWEMLNEDYDKTLFRESLEYNVNKQISVMERTYTPAGDIKVSESGRDIKTNWDMPIGAEIFPVRLSRERNFYSLTPPIMEDYPQPDDIIKQDFSCRVYHKKDSSGTIIRRGLEYRLRWGINPDDGCDLESLSEKLLAYLQPGQTYGMRFIINDHEDDGDFRKTIFNLSETFAEDIFVRINDNNNGILYNMGIQRAPFEWRQIADSDSDYIDIVADNGSETFIALNKKGEINQFTLGGQPYDRVPEGADFIKIFALKLTNGYLAMRADGSVVPWGMSRVANDLNGFVTGLKNNNDDAYSWNEFGLSYALQHHFIRYRGGALAFDGDPEVDRNDEKKTISYTGNLYGQLIFMEQGEIPSGDTFIKAFKPSNQDGSENFKAVPFRCRIKHTQSNATNGLIIGFNTGSDSGTKIVDPSHSFLEGNEDINLNIGKNGLPRAPAYVNRSTDITRMYGENGSYAKNACDLRSIPAKAAKVLEPNKTYIAIPTVRLGNKLQPFQSHDVRLDSRGLRRVNNGVTFNRISRDDLADMQEQKEGDYRETTIYSADGGFLTNNLDFWGSGLTGAKAKKLRDKSVTGKIITSERGTAVLSKVDGSIDFLAVQHCVISKFTGENCQGHPSDADKGYIKIYSNISAFAGLKADGTITAWGERVFDHMKGGNLANVPLKDRVVYRDYNFGESGAPTDGGYISIIASKYSFTAIKANGEMYTWGMVFANGYRRAMLDSGQTNIND